MRVALGLIIFLWVDNNLNHIENGNRIITFVARGTRLTQQGAILASSSGSRGKSLDNKKVTSSSSSHTTPDDYDDYKDELDEELDELDDDRFKINNKKTKLLDGEDLSKWDSTCPHEIEGLCHCGHRHSDPHDKSKIKYVVNCTDAGFTSADFLKFIPEETEVLIVRKNKIPELPLNVFGKDKLHLKLKEIDFSENEIEEIKGKSFHHVPNVELLILNFNKISQQTLQDHPRLFSNFISLKYLHLSGAFIHTEWLMQDLLDIFEKSNLTKLEKLHLEQNHIGRIPNSRQFCDLPALMDLHLGQNQLTDLIMDTNECLPSLRLIDLSFNQVKTVSKKSGLFELLQRTNQRGEPIQVDLYENPFQCDCQLDGYLEWLKNMSRIDPDRIRHRSSLRCKTGFPLSNANRILFSVSNTSCPVYTTTNDVINTLSWTVLSLILGAVFIILSAYYFYKVGTPAWLHSLFKGSVQSPLLMTTQGVKYTSIEKEEVAEVAHV